MAERLKPKVGIFSITSCAGCQESFLFIHDILPELLGQIEIVNFPMIKEQHEEGPFDIAFIEGAVVKEGEVEVVKDIRSKSKILIALGSCATYGGVPAMRDFGYEEDIMKSVYPVPSELHPTADVYGIGKYVEVDYYLRGCPMVKEEIVRVIKDLILKKKPREVSSPVCVECRANGNPCLLQMGQPCIGPVTFGGCNALCPTNEIPCYGCRGPLDDSNVDSLVSLLEKQGIDREGLKSIFLRFAGTSKKFKKIRE
ncbi:MAG: hypothetical protein V1921_00140 [Candidatus Altiarchaeota archaeon]